MSSEPLIRPGLSTSIKKNLPKIKAELRAKVPNLGLKDIQIRTLPYQELLRYELCCQGVGWKSLQLFDGMVANDIKTLESKKFHELSEIVRNSLKKFAEELKTGEILTLALYFEQHYETFPWTTEQLFEMALSEMTDDEALVQYHYANFYYCRKKSIEVASIKIQTALELARREIKNEKCPRSENDESASLIKAVMLLYFKIFLQKARRRMADDKQEAVQIAMRGMAMIDDSLHDDPLSKAHCCYEYGDFLQTNKLFLKAIDAYMAGMSEAGKLQDIPLKCKGFFDIATCHKEIMNMEKAEKYARKLYDLAIDDLWKAEASLLLAQINPEENLDKAENSLEIFQSLPSFPGKQEKLDQVRLIVAKLKATKIFPSYLQNIRQSEMGSRSHFFNLLNWQTSREM